MNIFFLHADPETCADQHCCAHVVKLCNEALQLLVTALSETQFGGGPIPEGYFGAECDPLPKPTHRNHPMALAVRKSRAVFSYAADLGLALCRRYAEVFSVPGKPKQRKTAYVELLRRIRAHGLRVPSNEPFSATTTVGRIVLATNTETEPGTGAEAAVPLCMPPGSMVGTDVVASYRRYFNEEKQHLARWPLAETPAWYTGPVLAPLKAEQARWAKRSGGVIKAKTKTKTKARAAVGALLRELDLRLRLARSESLTLGNRV